MHGSETTRVQNGRSIPRTRDLGRLREEKAEAQDKLGQAWGQSLISD